MIQLKYYKEIQYFKFENTFNLKKLILFKTNIKLIVYYIKYI